MPSHGPSLVFDRVANCYDETRGGEARGRFVASHIEPRLRPTSSVDVTLKQLRPGDDDRNAVIGDAEAAGLTPVHAGDIVVELEQSPNDLIDNIERRAFAYLWNLDDDTWARVTRPVIDSLRQLPDPDRRRHRVQRHDLLVFERA